MSDPSNPNIQKRSTPQWALYQRENFWKANDGEVPPFNTGDLLGPILDESDGKAHNDLGQIPKPSRRKPRKD
jgi:hypothetical protein